PKPPRPTPPALVEATSVSLQTVKIKSPKTTVLVIQFGAGLDASAASNVGAYRLVTAGRDKKFGTKDDKVIRLASASYNDATHAVRLTPRTALPKAQTLQLRALSSALRDTFGRPIDGDHDAQPGGDLVASVARGKVRIAAMSVMAIDAVLDSDAH